MFDLIIWLLVMWLIFGGGTKKKKPPQTHFPQDLEQNERQIIEEIRPEQTEQTEQLEREPGPQVQRPQTKTIVFGDLGTFVREFVDLMTDDDEELAKKQAANPPAEQAAPVFSEMSHEDIARRKREMVEKRNRRLSKAKAVEIKPADECEYCTGEAEVSSTITVHSAPAKPVVISDKRNVRDVAAACGELGLNPLQQAVVWTEVLDKPLALRKRR